MAIKKSVGAPASTPNPNPLTGDTTNKNFITDNGTRLNYALLFFDLGVKIVPCRPKSKAFLAGYGPHKKHITDDITLARLLDKRPFNYALVTGTGRGPTGRGQKRLVVIDFDAPEVFAAWQRQAGVLANTFTVKTARGYHIYYWADDVRSWRGTGFEVMGVGKAVMGVWSVHPGGTRYTPQNRPWIRTIESLADFPLLSDMRPVLPKAPAVRPDRLGGGIVSKIKRTVFILDVIENRPVLAQRVRLQSSDGGRGRWYAGLCPFHEDRNPSFWVDAQRNLFGCRACSAHGDVINFLALLEGKTPRTVIRELTAGMP
jgi:hypothetical protein